jgi:lipoprotein-anchoring transpeptidase ErfK/SrfK
VDGLNSSVTCAHGCLTFARPDYSREAFLNEHETSLRQRIDREVWALRDEGDYYNHRQYDVRHFYGSESETRLPRAEEEPRPPETSVQPGTVRIFEIGSRRGRLGTRDTSGERWDRPPPGKALKPRKSERSNCACTRLRGRSPWRSASMQGGQEGTVDDSNDVREQFRERIEVDEQVCHRTVEKGRPPLIPLRRVSALTAAVLLFGANLEAQLPALRSGATGHAVATLQVALSNRGFSPGLVDGRFGRLLVGALLDYQYVHGLKTDGVAGPAVWRELGISAIRPTTGFRVYTVVSEDTVGLAVLPASWAARARFPYLPHQSVLERLAERFQASRRYVVTLNRRVSWPNPRPGTKIRVPAVEFHTMTVAESPDGALKARWEKGAPAGVEVWVSSRKRAVYVFQNRNAVARYPASVGSREFPNPEGSWKIVSQVYAPDYRYDRHYLKTGRRSPSALRLPPGPNNIVGLMWLGLNKEGFGVHGSADPETIGRATSHGCVRLTNWDAQRLAQWVGIGTPVTISR